MLPRVDIIMKYDSMLLLYTTVGSVMISDQWTIDFHGQASSQPLFHNEGTFVGLPCQKSLSVLTQFNPIFSIKTNRCQNYLKYVPRVVYIAAAFFTEREGERVPWIE